MDSNQTKDTESSDPKVQKPVTAQPEENSLARLATLDELTVLSQELGMGYDQ